MYFVYILRSKKDKVIYIGFTPDLRNRFLKHNQGKVKSTKSKTPLDLVYFEAYKSKQEAKNRESSLKLYSNAWAQLKNRIKQSIS